MTQIEPRLFQLLVSKLCHDLISPIGAIGNGLELIAEDSKHIVSEALDLSTRSAQRANVVLKLFRCAYGAAGDQASFGLAEARRILEEYFAGSRVQLAWPLVQPAVNVPGLSRMIVNLTMLAAETLPRGGTVMIEFMQDGEKMVTTFTAKGQDARFPGEMLESLSNRIDAANLTPKTAHARFIDLMARAYHGHVTTLEAGPAMPSFILTLPVQITSVQTDMPAAAPVMATQ